MWIFRLWLFFVATENRSLVNNPSLPMTSLPIRYVEPVFRPPSEGNSLILPVTDGCSWNKCTFCEMYTAKHVMAGMLL